MTAQMAAPLPVPEDATAAAPVVVIGGGPVGVRFVQELRRRAPAQPVVLYDNEPFAPYNRVQLTAFLAGEISVEQLATGDSLAGGPTELRLHCGVVDINAANKKVIDARGRETTYSTLVLATGSRPRVPDIPGIGQRNVFVFRTLSDALRLQARMASSRRIVVIGGGLLGLESARAMQRMGDGVIVVDHNPRLMMNQLDDSAAERLQQHIAGLGIEVLLNEPVARLHGEGKVTGVRLRSGTVLSCDTVLVAAGIVPLTELAVLAGLRMRRGVQVDDHMRSSDPSIYAIGECSEHRDRTYGVVAPGFEQAAVAAHAISGGPAADYTGSVVASRLKVLDLPVFSVGRVTERDRLERAEILRWRDETRERVLVLEDGKLIGAMSVGESPESIRLQEAVVRHRRVYWWQKQAFLREGLLWPDAETSVVGWPAEAIVCQCNGITRGQLADAVAAGCGSVDQLAACTRASTVCGSCKPLLADLVGQPAPEAQSRWQKPLLVGAAVALAISLPLFLLPGLPYAASVQHALPWDELWRQSSLKQLTGYSVLAVSLAGLLLSLRKRWAPTGEGRLARLLRGDFTGWRFAHSVLGLSALLALWAHTGGRIGSGIDAMLMTAFALALLAGAAMGLLLAKEKKLAPRAALRWRNRALHAHFWPLWPVPALLGAHVLKTYFF